MVRLLCEISLHTVRLNTGYPSPTSITNAAPEVEDKIED